MSEIRLADLAERLKPYMASIAAEYVTSEPAGGAGGGGGGMEVHDIDGAWHTVTGSQWQLVGLTGANTLGLLTPSSDPTGQAILMSDANGRLGLEALGLGEPAGAYDVLRVTQSGTNPSGGLGTIAATASVNDNTTYYTSGIFSMVHNQSIGDCALDMYNLLVRYSVNTTVKHTGSIYNVMSEMYAYDSGDMGVFYHFLAGGGYDSGSNTTIDARYGLRIASSAFVITGTEYGIYMDNINHGATNNYAIYTNEGYIRFGDTVAIATSNNDFQVLRVAGTWNNAGSYVQGIVNNVTVTDPTTDYTGIADVCYINPSGATAENYFGLEVQNIYQSSYAHTGVMEGISVRGIQHTSTGSVQWVRGIRINDPIIGSGSIDDYRGLWIDASTFTATSKYALFIGNFSGGTTHNYSIYTDGGVNRLGGRTEIIAQDDTSSATALYISNNVSGVVSQHGYGVHSYVFSNDFQSAYSMTAIYARPYFQDTTNSSLSINGMDAALCHSTSATLARATGVGTNVYLYGGGTISQFFGFEVGSGFFPSGGSVTERYGLRVYTPATNVVNNYALYIDDQRPATGSEYAIYVLGGDYYYAYGDIAYNTVDMATSNYVSQTTGWSLDYAGNLDVRYIFANEMHVQAFIADIYEAFVGAIIVTKSRARLSRNFTIPSNGNSATLYVEDLEGWQNVQLFESGDYVLLRYINTNDGGLVVADVWGTVSAYSDLAEGEQSYSFTTTDAGGVAGSVVYAGSIAMDYGTSGGGGGSGDEWFSNYMADRYYAIGNEYFPVSAASGSGNNIKGAWEATVLDNAGAPYSQVKSWTTNPWTPANWTVHTRLGNLEGITSTLEYGLWAGSGYTTTDQYLIVSDQNIEFHNIPIKLYNGSTQTVLIDSDGDAFFGSNLGAVSTTSLAIFSNAQTYNSESMGAGDILIGDHGNANMLWDVSDGQLKFRGGTTVEAYIDTDGSIVAGSNTVYINSGGLAILTSGTKNMDNAYKFMSGTTAYSGLYGIATASYNDLVLVAEDIATTNSRVFISVDAPVSYTSEIHLDRYINGSKLSYITIANDIGISANNIVTVASETSFSAGKVRIGSDGNSYQTYGLTIDQGTYHEEILTLQSTTDVSHSFTATESGTYGVFRKDSDAAGGLQVIGYRDSDDVAGRALSLIGRLDEAADTAKSTSAIGVITTFSQISSSGNPASVGSDGNLFVVTNHGTARWIVDAEGDTHRDGSDNTFDAYDDVMLARAFALETSVESAIKDEWDNWVRYNRDTLVEAGIMSPEGFYNESALTRLLVGAVWQIGKRLMVLEQDHGK